MSEKPGCLICRKKLTPASAVGRPLKYCGTTCRRVAEYRITRLNRLIGRLEDRLVMQRLDRPEYFDATDRRRWQREIDAAENRLRELLEDPHE